MVHQFYIIEKPSINVQIIVFCCTDLVGSLGRKQLLFLQAMQPAKFIFNYQQNDINWDSVSKFKRTRVEMSEIKLYSVSTWFS